MIPIDHVHNKSRNHSIYNLGPFNRSLRSLYSSYIFKCIYAQAVLDTRVLATYCLPCDNQTPFDMYGWQSKERSMIAESYSMRPLVDYVNSETEHLHVCRICLEPVISEKELKTLEGLVSLGGHYQARKFFYDLGFDFENKV